MIENENQLIIFLTNKHFLYTFKIIFISVLLLYYNNNNSHKYIHFVELDNKIESSFYEKDVQYNNFDSNIKIFSIYYPEFTFLKIQSNNYQDLIRFKLFGKGSNKISFKPWNKWIWNNILLNK